MNEKCVKKEKKYVSDNYGGAVADVDTASVGGAGFASVAGVVAGDFAGDFAGGKWGEERGRVISVGVEIFGSCEIFLCVDRLF